VSEPQAAEVEVLHAIELTKHYASIPAVQNVNFELMGGEILGCLGPNGSGKSTTVKMLTGLLEPSRGRVLFRGEDIRTDLVSYRKKVGYVPEEPNLYPYLSGREYLEMVGILRGIPPLRLAQKIDHLLELLSLYPSRHSAMASYSKGMRQRVLLIAALLDDPEVLILDEPLSGLDVSSALVLKTLIRTLARHGKAIFYCSHVLEVVELVCSHLLILRRGVVIESGLTGDIRKRIGHSSLEGVFHHLVAEVEPEKVTREIIDVIRAA
jgi:ABC-2 type transport system ATP-binding protein